MCVGVWLLIRLYGVGTIVVDVYKLLLIVQFKHCVTMLSDKCVSPQRQGHASMGQQPQHHKHYVPTWRWLPAGPSTLLAAPLMLSVL